MLPATLLLCWLHLQAALDQQDTTVTTFTAEVITTYAHIPLPFKLLARSMVAPCGEDTYSIIVVISVEGHSVADGYDKCEWQASLCRRVDVQLHACSTA